MLLKHADDVIDITNFKGQPVHFFSAEGGKRQSDKQGACGKVIADGGPYDGSGQGTVEQ